MKESKDKSEKSSGKAAEKPSRPAVSPVRSAWGTHRTGKKAVIRREMKDTALPDFPMEQAVSVHAGGLEQNFESLKSNNTDDPLRSELIPQETAPGDYLSPGISSTDSETLSEYFAEEEAEEAMREADLAMREGECALFYDEGSEPVELEQEEIVAEWAKGSSINEM